MSGPTPGAVVNRCTTGLAAAVAMTWASAAASCAVSCSHNVTRGRSMACSSAGSSRSRTYVPNRSASPRPDAQPLTAHQRAHVGDGPPARPHQQVAHPELPPHLALLGRHAMRRAIRSHPAGLRQHQRIPPVGLHPPPPRRIHRGVVRIRHDHVMATLLDRLRHPFAFRRCLEQHVCPRPRRKHGGECLPRALDAPLDDLALRRQDADLTFPFVHVDANMLHGWSPFVRLERV